MRYAVLLLAVIVVQRVHGQVATTMGEERTEPRESVFGIGLSCGPVSGAGLSFRHHLPSRFSYQIVAGIIKTSSRIHYDVGGELQFDFTLGEGARVIGLAGAGYYFSGDNSSNELEAPFRMGIGIGGEYELSENVGLQGELLFTFFSDGVILPLPQAAVHYYFR